MGLFDNIFGYTFQKSKKEKFELKHNDSPVPPTNDDGAVTVEGGVYGSYLDIDGTIKTEFELITRYREMSLYPELDTAIENIVNEAIVMEDETAPIEIRVNTDDHPELKSIQTQIHEEFKHILRLLDFQNQGYEIFRKWYIDGRLYFHAVVTQGKEKEGIKELRFIDPRQIRKIRVIDRDKDEKTQADLISVVEEFYSYNPRGVAYPTGQSANNAGLVTSGQGGTMTGVKLSKEAVVHCHSGLTDRYSSIIISFLHKAIRPLNQLKMMEDASVIYRITRAPERRIFYIDVMGLPKTKADQYMREMMQRYRNKLVYDAATGEVKDDRKFTTMLEDIWLPRRNGQNMTDIDTLPGGDNLGEIEDIEYFLKKLYRSLNVPVGRLDPNNALNVGRASEITRDELNFVKFITRLRLRFSMLFDSLLERQLVLKGIITTEEWSEVKQAIFYRYAKDNYFSEMKNNEILKEKLITLQQCDAYQGKYFSVEYIRKNVLHQDTEDIKQLEKEMEEEKDKFPSMLDALEDTTEPAPMAPAAVKKTKQTPKQDKKRGRKVGSGGNALPGGSDTNKI